MLSMLGAYGYSAASNHQLNCIPLLHHSLDNCPLSSTTVIIPPLSSEFPFSKSLCASSVL